MIQNYSHFNELWFFFRILICIAIIFYLEKKNITKRRVCIVKINVESKNNKLQKKKKLFCFLLHIRDFCSHSFKENKTQTRKELLFLYKNRFQNCSSFSFQLLLMTFFFLRAWHWHRLRLPMHILLNSSEFRCFPCPF